MHCEAPIATSKTVNLAEIKSNKNALSASRAAIYFSTIRSRHPSLLLKQSNIYRQLQCALISIIVPVQRPRKETTGTICANPCRNSKAYAEMFINLLLDVLEFGNGRDGRMQRWSISKKQPLEFALVQ